VPNENNSSGTHRRAQTGTGGSFKMARAAAEALEPLATGVTIVEAATVVCVRRAPAGQCSPRTLSYGDYTLDADAMGQLGEFECVHPFIKQCAIPSSFRACVTIAPLSVLCDLCVICVCVICTTCNNEGGISVRGCRS
jgi:hypothetical protein